jgi:hypothetical protein
MSAFSEYEAIIRHTRYEEAGACADLIREMRQDSEGENDPSHVYREKHTDRVLTHDEVYRLALHNAFSMIYERMEEHYGEGR